MIVDVFTDTPLQGNQLAVFEDGSTRGHDQMQRLAREMNLSGTVFLLPAEARRLHRQMFTFTMPRMGCYCAGGGGL